MVTAMNGKPVLVIMAAGMGSHVDRWYGVTYKEDKETVVNAIRELKKAGIYPERLWEEQ